MSGKQTILNLRVGDLVEIRSQSEILATLDSTGRLDGLPFMPEMLDHCGKRFRVYKRADKTCDTIGRSGSRRMEHAVHLEGLRCDGSAHGSCQARCLIFWKEAWLKSAGNAFEKTSDVNQPQSSAAIKATQSKGKANPCTEATLFNETRKISDDRSVDADIFSCQATELLKATSYLAWWDVRQYIRDVRSGNITFPQLFRGAVIAATNMAKRNLHQCAVTIGASATFLWGAHSESVELSSSLFATSMGPISAKIRIKEKVMTLLNDLLVEYPRLLGKKQKTPSIVLNLQPGELVQVKSAAEIVETLDAENKNRGLRFDVEMLPYCGRTYRVLHRVEKIIDEKSGRMLKLQNDCIILDGVMCKACYSTKRLFCPRSIYSYWREIWLKRVASSGSHQHT
jgi:hypothetical protein